MKLKVLLSMGFLLVLVASLTGKEKDQFFYPASTISDVMKKDAYAVCRKYRHEFELIDYGKAIEKVHLVVTVLEENGDHFGQLVLPYDNSKKIKSISGRIYDAAGISDDKLKNSAIQDVNYTSSGQMYDDLRLKLADFKIKVYPYTIEYQYEIEHDGLIGYPDWQPIEDYRLSVEKSSFHVSYPENLEIRVREVNIPSGCRTEKNETGTHFDEWKLDSIAAWRSEPMSPPLYTQTSRVIIAPTNFTYDSSDGKMTSWNELGKWVSGLNNGRDQLPLPRQAEIRNLTGEIKDTTLAVNALYQYMQKRTRYVGIQLGLGGFQPFPAETVDRLGYGDCKALSNYMKSLLNCVGIPSLYVLAGAGPNLGITMPDFPTINQNNHAILCVPSRNDTIWLECTSQDQPGGYLGTFVAGRKVMLITPEGGKLTVTPLLTSKQNLQFRAADVQIDPDGAMKATVKTRYSGYQYDNVSSLFDESKEDQEKELLESIGIPGLVLNSFGYEVKKDKIPEAIESLTMTSAKYATKTGTRLFIPMNMLNQRKSNPARVDSRKMPVEQKYSFHDKDSIVFQLPKGYQVETIPRDKTITTEYGDYTSKMTVQNDLAIYVREVKINPGFWPKENYKEVVEFYSNIVSNDKAKLVLKEQVQ
ncbi:MAG: DUF3857 and transglutaminase domain-containing protein [Prolixibacteraceae bacterium]|nr:DUF3857 and transglutaminase domain-containing protein [Prolixibacteraceae bacterium]